jgi:CBS domain containing-hemolysin-like protein
MAEVGHEEGAIDAQERELIHAAFTFGDTVVREVMVPRPDVLAIEERRPLRDVVALVLEHGHSRIPVYRDQIDHVEGVVYVKDLLRHVSEGRDDIPLKEVMRPAHFVPESKRVADLLKDMQRHKFHMAVVTDEYGSVSGVVTLEDLLEELVGEIADEWDREEPELEERGLGVYRVAGSMPIRELADAIDVPLPSEDWDTVGGLMLGLLGAIPREGQEVRCGRVVFKAEKVQRRRVLSVLATVRPADPSGPSIATS